MNRRQFLKGQLITALAASSVGALGGSRLAQAALRTPISTLFPSQSRRDEIQSVVIVGGGIAGLAAAYTLQRAGVNVLVLEANPELGGRMSTHYVGGMTIDNAAQIVSNSYDYVPALLNVTGLEQNLTEIKTDFGIERGGKLHQWQLTKPHTLVTGGLIRWNELPFASLLNAIPEILESACIKADKNVTGWARYDDQPAQAWVQSSFGEALTEYFFDPLLAALYFKGLSQVSKATFLSVATSAFPNKKAYVLKGGIGSLCKALGERVKHRLNCQVLGLRQDAGTSGRVTISTSQGKFSADAVILALPAPAAQSLYRGQSSPEAEILATAYTPSITLSVLTRSTWTRTFIPSSWNSIYPSRSSRNFIYMAFTSTKNVFNNSSGAGMLKFILSGPRIDEIWSRSDQEIFEQIASETSSYLPGLLNASEFITSARFRHGMPDPGVGRFIKIKNYRRFALRQRPRILLAGDYTSHITTDGAAESGIWAAHQLLNAGFGCTSIL